MKVLYVEDNEINRLVVLKLLEATADIQTVEDGYSALEVVDNQSFDLIMLDLNLNDPNMDGFDVLREMKRKEKVKDSAFVAVTAFTGKEWEDKCNKAGFNKFYSKPIDPITILNDYRNGYE